MSQAPVSLPAYFGAEGTADVFFQPYTNGGKPVRTQVVLSHHLISLVQDGSKEVIVAERHEQVDASRLILLSAGSGIMSEHSLKGKPMRSLLLFMAPDFLEDFCIRHGLKPELPATGLLTLPQDAYTRLFARSVETFGSERLNADAALRGNKAGEILLYLQTKEPHSFAQFLGAALLDRDRLSLKAVVARHLDANLTISELAFLCNMGETTFKRKFREVFGTAPGRWMHEQRMDRAKALLERRMRPSEIFTDLGYESLSAFSSAFKQHFGTTPTALLQGKA